MASKDKSKSGIYRGIAYESDAERYALYYFFELQNAGIVKSIKRAESFNLSDKISVEYTQIKKTRKKEKIEQKLHTLLREHIYTPEFKIEWEDFDFNKFIWKNYDNRGEKPYGLISSKETHLNGFPITYIECKNKFDYQNMSRLFVINQKWVYEKLDIFINLFIPEETFKNTFTPLEYMKTPTGKDKKINFEVRTLEQYLKL